MRVCLCAVEFPLYGHKSKCVCLRACVYEYLRVCVHVCMNICVYVCACVYEYLHVYVCMCV